jgi:hypothetical protein
MEDLSSPLWQVKTNAFPQPITLSGLDSVSYGTLIINYPVSTVQSVTDGAGNVTQQTVTEMKSSEPIKVPFTKIQ